MNIIQPSNLKEYFSLDDELHLQDKLKKQFQGMAQTGFYTLSWEEQGLSNQNYLVGFLVEVSDRGDAYIIECYIAHVDEISRKNFDEKIEKLSDNAESNPQTTIARATYKQKRKEITQERNRIDRMRGRKN